jgi:hypothetical protein
MTPTITDVELECTGEVLLGPLSPPTIERRADLVARFEGLYTEGDLSVERDGETLRAVRPALWREG